MRPSRGNVKLPVSLESSLTASSVPRANPKYAIVRAVSSTELPLHRNEEHPLYTGNPRGVRAYTLISIRRRIDILEIGSETNTAVQKKTLPEAIDDEAVHKLLTAPGPATSFRVHVHTCASIVLQCDRPDPEDRLDPRRPSFREHPRCPTPTTASIDRQCHRK